LIGRVEYGEADLILTLFTELLGKVSVVARAARRSNRRFGGCLEPMHSLWVEVDERMPTDLLMLREARILTPRLQLIGRLECLDAAGIALRWVKQAAPVHTPEPQVWSLLIELLDELDQTSNADFPSLVLAETGLRLLGAFGWAPELERCVRCATPCPENKRAFFNPARGGLICSQCGGARIALAPERRLRMARASQGTRAVLEREDIDVVLDLIERCLVEHANFSQSQQVS
jgi:DNA repair protein RecO (recombination protein O)